MDYSHVFVRRAYYVFNCQMKLLKWYPKFDIKEDSPVVPIWISFPDLHPHFINHRILFALASMYGRPLQVDQATAAGTRPSVARVLVEIDITKQYPNQVWLGDDKYGYIQKVTLDNFLSFCSHC